MSKNVTKSNRLQSRSFHAQAHDTHLYLSLNAPAIIISAALFTCQIIAQLFGFS
jgi:hypothetical protein